MAVNTLNARIYRGRQPTRADVWVWVYEVITI